MMSFFTMQVSFHVYLLFIKILPTSWSQEISSSSIWEIVCPKHLLLFE